MKNFKTTLLFGGLLALATSMNAQSSMIKVEVPFAFVAGGYAMPAGSYTIEEPTTHGVLLLRGTQPNSTAMVLVVSAGPSSASHVGVKFSHRGSAVVLSSIDVPGGESYTLVTPEHKTAAAVNVSLPRK